MTDKAEAAAAAATSPTGDGDVWVEDPAAADWETSEMPVGLEDGNPLVVESTKTAMKPRESGDVVTRMDQPPAHHEKEKPESFAEREARECTFKPDLSATEKARKKVESHKYGTAAVVVKPRPEPETPSFKPDLEVGKSTTKKRLSASGSQYGKVAVVVKPVVAPTPDFKPHLVDTGKSKALRDSASPRYLASAEKFKDVGKKSRAQVAEKKPGELPKYSLYGDRPATAPAGPEKPNFVVDTVLVAERDPLRKRTLAPVPPVKHSKHGEVLKAKATSHYAKTAYTPPKGEKAKAKAERGWAPTLGTKDAGIASVDQLTTVKNKKTETARSNYAPDAYKPKRADRPKTAPAAKKAPEFNLLLSSQSPLDKPAAEIVAPKKSKKFDRVPSSGYGVKSPPSSIPAKVHSYKHRSAANQMRTSDYRGEMDSGRESANSNRSNAENEQPEGDMSDASMAHINDLIEKAASLDPKHAAAAAAAEGPVEVALGDGEQLTML